MSKNTWLYDVCIVGTGRVGLPLGLSFVERGLRATGLDADAALRESINRGVMPFVEPGFESTIATGTFQVGQDPRVVEQSQAVVITVGTPLHTHIETDLRQVRRVLKDIAPFLRPGHLLCLRSTVAPRTTEYVRRWVERHTDLRVGDTLHLAFCPERIAEGKAKEELRSLPQIVGADDPASGEAAAALFGRLAAEVLPTNCITAELVKLFNNSARYIAFATANQFALIADSFGVSIHEARRLANHRYPRHTIASPGLTAGTCLRKDFGMINEASPYPDLLLSAWKMNEYTPAFLVQHMEQRLPLHETKVAVLGFSFKADTDDTRDSLAPKLYRTIERRMPLEIRVSDDNLPPLIEEETIGAVENWSTESAITAVDCIFIAMNHRGYAEALRAMAPAHPQTWIADIWDVCGTGLMFFQAQELLLS